MRSDFCTFIISHGRPDKVITYNTIMKAGYTGKVYIVIDDEDKTGEQYKSKYPGIVLVFSKEEMSKTFDEGDNFNNRRTTTYARNACWHLARSLGVKYFLVLDDDYTGFELRGHSKSELQYVKINRYMDVLIEDMLEFFIRSGAASTTFSQGGDWIGGAASNWDEKGASLRRKAMNSFFCSTDRPYLFEGRLNEDVNTYVTLGRRGFLFLTVMQAKLVQLQTQKSAGGMTEAYLDAGTYVKSFYTVMYAPSCVQVGVMGDPRSGNYRMHHAINWGRAVPCILREKHRKPRSPDV
jgi:hypothetical protein